MPKRDDGFGAIVFLAIFVVALATTGAFGKSCQQSIGCSGGGRSGSALVDPTKH